MILYEQLLTYMQSVIMAETITGVPAKFKATFDYLWLGRKKSDLFEVEIKEDKDKLGWLYGNSNIFLFSLNGVLYHGRMKALKDLVEEKLKEKKFSSEPEVNKLTKSVTGAVTGYLNMEDVINASVKIV